MKLRMGALDVMIGKSGVWKLIIYYISVFLLATASLYSPVAGFSNSGLAQENYHASVTVSHPYSDASLSLLQSDGNDSARIWAISRIKLRGTFATRPDTNQNISWYQQGLTPSGYTDVCFYTGNLDSVFSPQRQQACQLLDIPPPGFIV